MALYYLPEMFSPREGTRLEQLESRFGGLEAEEPILCIGPHWPYAVLTFFLTNITISTMMSMQPMRFKYGYMFAINILIHLLWNFSFVITCLYTPGIHPRNPEIHSTEYLKSIASKNLVYLICKDCKIIHREQTEGIVYHCPDCNVCIENHEDHLKFFGKCVGKRTKNAFFVTIVLSLG